MPEGEPETPGGHGPPPRNLRTREAAPDVPELYHGEETGRVYRDGRFHTMDPSRPEVSALGIWHGRIVYAGDDPGAAEEKVRSLARAFAGARKGAVCFGGAATGEGSADCGTGPVAPTSSSPSCASSPPSSPALSASSSSTSASSPSSVSSQSSVSSPSPVSRSPAPHPEAEAYAFRADAARGAGIRVETVSLEGRPAVPGLIDSHSHLITEGVRLSQLDVFGKSREDAARLAGEKAAALEPGAWLHGRGWDQNLWPGRAWPHRKDLDRACPRNPTVIDRVDKHSVWVNTRALDRAGILADTPDPPGGEIVRDPDGTPSGVLVGRAMRLVYDVMPPWDGLDPMEAYLAAEREMLSFGLTAAVDCGTRRRDFLMLTDAYRAGVPKIRFKAFMQADPWEEEILGGGPRRGLYGGRFSLDGVKLFSDGSLGSRSAWLADDYADRPGHRGGHNYGDGDLEAVMARIRDRGLQAAIHVIGDAAAEQAVRVMGRVLGKGAPTRRWRLEHLQMVPGTLAREIAALGLIPSIQSVGLMTDLHMAGDRLGPGRLKDAYAWRRLADLGLRLINGSDAPIESPDPFRGIYAACARRDLDWRPAEGFGIGDALTLHEAFLSYTVWPAWACFCDGELGTLSEGMRADFAVLDRDPFQIPVRELHAVKPVMTVIGGSPAWMGAGF